MQSTFDSELIKPDSIENCAAVRPKRTLLRLLLEGFSLEGCVLVIAHILRKGVHDESRSISYVQYQAPITFVENRFFKLLAGLELLQVHGMNKPVALLKKSAPINVYL